MAVADFQREQCRALQMLSLPALPFISQCSSSPLGLIQGMNREEMPEMSHAWYPESLICRFGPVGQCKVRK